MTTARVSHGLVPVPEGQAPNRRYCLITPCRDEARYARKTPDSVVRARSSSSHCGERVTQTTLAKGESPASIACDLSTAGEANGAGEHLTLQCRLLISNDSFHAWNDRI